MRSFGRFLAFMSRRRGHKCTHIIADYVDLMPKINEGKTASQVKSEWF